MEAVIGVQLILEILIRLKRVMMLVVVWPMLQLNNVYMAGDEQKKKHFKYSIL